MFRTDFDLFADDDNGGADLFATFAAPVPVLTDVELAELDASVDVDPLDDDTAEFLAAVYGDDMRGAL